MAKGKRELIGQKFVISKPAAGVGVRTEIGIGLATGEVVHPGGDDARQPGERINLPTTAQSGLVYAHRVVLWVHA